MQEETARCTKCGSEFERRTDQRWKRVCLSCFIDGKREEEQRESDRAWAREEAARKERELQQQQRQQQSIAIPGEMIRLLVQLCHPDKHGGSNAALKATQWLLK